MSKQDPSNEYAIGVLEDGTAVKTDDVAKMPMGIKYAVNAGGMVKWQTAFMVQLYNKYADKPIKKFKDKQTAAERLYTLLSERAEEYVPADLPKTVKAKVTAKPNSSNKRNRSKLDTTKKVKIVEERAAKVQSGVIKNRLEHYKGKPTVQSILDKKIEDLGPRDVAYDVKQGYVELV
tara:strand:+ start:1485 stop:2015 length:531 start_codon:yes stop_codon:yes gene_type:complete